MARKATGTITERERKQGVLYALRFMAGGVRRYETLGGSWEGWTRKQAEAALRHTMADVERGTWKPAAPVQVLDLDSDPTFHVFASEWYAAHEGEWRPKTQRDYQWKLSGHLLPFFKDHLLSQITAAEVDRFKTVKLKQGTLAPRSINKAIALLAQILDTAVEYDSLALEKNAAKGKRRRLKVTKAAPVWLDSAEHIRALLDAAGELDREAPSHRQIPRRAMLATLLFAGLRIGELADLCWRDVDLAAGWITVGQDGDVKTDAGQRRVRIRPTLRDELTVLKASAKDVSSDMRVFATLGGSRLNDSNFRSRVLGRGTSVKEGKERPATGAVKRANIRLEESGSTPLPAKLTPHKLRHTFCSLLVAIGTDIGVVMEEMGHTDPGFTLSVYRHGMRRDEKSKQQLRELLGVDTQLAPIGTSAGSDPRLSVLEGGHGRADMAA
jgi:integrase